MTVMSSYLICHLDFMSVLLKCILNSEISVRLLIYVNSCYSFLHNPPKPLNLSQLRDTDLPVIYNA